ncbi:MAG: thiamine/thiamine pyrophosphate ABC transporter permease ThiP [Arenibacterium sp.]
MARRAQPVSAIPGAVAACAAAAFILLPLVAVALRADAGGAGMTPADWVAIRFTLTQAFLSALFSLVLAVPVARALSRRRFVGRNLLITLLGAPFILPVIVAVLGLLAVFGRAGWVSDALGLLGLPPVQIYGLHGVVLAHVFFNLPLATRLILQGWQEIPAERFRLAAQLGAGPSEIRWLLEWPMLKRTLPGAFIVIFALCLTSFAVALTLGGGPRATTIELAIYQAVLFEYDFDRAALLALIQIALTLGVAIIGLGFAYTGSFGAGLDRPVQRWDARALHLKVMDSGLILVASVFLLLPLLAIVFAGLPGLLDLPGVVVSAAGLSILVAGASTLIMLGFAIPMAVALAARAKRGNWIELAGLLGLAVSPLVIGTGLFILLFPLVDPGAMALPVTACVNALMALPFALRILVPAARDAVTLQGRLALSLGLSKWTFLRLVLLPRMRPQIGFAAGLCAALSMGDLGVIALFADPELATLPLQVFRLMGAYQMQTASAAALVLLVLSVALFWLLDRGGKRFAET